MQSFQLVAINSQPFEHLFDLSDDQLKAMGVMRCFATENPGFPCRVSLEDADVGEELLLIPYEHHPVLSPYRASGPIFIRRGVKPKYLPVGEVPDYVTRRLISVRAYNGEHMMVTATVCEGIAVAAEIERIFADSKVAYIQLHNAKQGCFSCQVNRT
jgi:hypothetical protein